MKFPAETLARYSSYRLLMLLVMYQCLLVQWVDDKRLPRLNCSTALLVDSSYCLFIFLMLLWIHNINAALDGTNWWLFAVGSLATSGGLSLVAYREIINRVVGPHRVTVGIRHHYSGKLIATCHPTHQLLLAYVTAVAIVDYTVYWWITWVTLNCVRQHS